MRTQEAFKERNIVGHDICLNRHFRSLLFTIRSAVIALSRHRIRSFLTTLGIIIGVSCVIVIVAVVQGAQAMVIEQIRNLGSNLLTVMPTERKTNGVKEDTKRHRLTLTDAAAIYSECPEITCLSPRSGISVSAVCGNKNWPTRTLGVGLDYPYIRCFGVANGRFFDQLEIDHAEKVCLLGQTVAKALTGDRDPTGAIVRINKTPFLVIGCLKAKGLSPDGNHDQDNVILAPYTTVMKRLNHTIYLGSIEMSAASREIIDEATARLDTVMRRRHGLDDSEEADFIILATNDAEKEVDAACATLLLFLGSVASIALLVGGVGIMNIMWVTTSERTREIGIRRAVGATEGQILLQFLIEAVVLAVVGGAAGILLGILASPALGWWLNWPLLVNPQAVLIAFGCAGLVGVTFGILPAWNASRLDPIVALKPGSGI